MSTQPPRRVLQWLLGGILFAYIWKAAMWVDTVRDLARMPVVDPLFPRMLTSEVPLGIALALPPLAICAALLVHRLDVARGAFIVATLSSTLLMVHQASYNDASFVTVFWSSLYGVWLTRALHIHDEARENDDFPSSLATLLACTIIALMFLGGAVGKLTPGYWDGSVLYALNFAHSHYWSFRLARSLLSETELRELATLYSRSVVCVEIAMVTLPLWPRVYALWCAAALLLAMTALNNVFLLSVLGPLIGMCGAALCCTRLEVVPRSARSAIQTHRAGPNIYPERARS